MVLFPTLVALMSAPIAHALPKTRIRAEIPEKYKWDLAVIYPDWEAWEKDYARLETMMDQFAALSGSVKQGPKELLQTMRLYDDLNILAYRVFRYPQLLHDTDTRDNDVSGKLQRVYNLWARFRTSTAWLNPELLSIGWDHLDGWFAGEKGLAPYRHNLEDLYRQQEHVLDERGEKLLSYFNRLGAAPDDIYTHLSTSDVKFPTIALSDGQEVTLSRAQYGLVLTVNRNQEDRRRAFEAHYQVFKDNANTYAAIYNGVCQNDWALAQSRNYTTTLGAALDKDNVPLEVYENLVNITKAGTEPLRRWYRLRKKVLGLETYHLYDGAVTLVESEKTYEYDAIQPWVAASVAPLGREYQDNVGKAFASRWLDVFENEGKDSGAYSAGVYGVHPFMLLNYNGTMSSVFTVAHEMGHTMHTLLSYANQPFATADYTIFVAEVASTLNEALFLDYMLERAKDPKDRVALLSHAIQTLDGTFYTQVMFADFELQAHRLVEKGEPITADALNQIMQNIQRDYFGDTVAADELYGVLWSRISHFFGSPYYVYKYATCFASSAQIYERIGGKDRKAREAAVQRYLTLLKSGGNDYPMEQLRNAGVDLTRPENFQAVVETLDDLVTRLEKEVAKL